MLLWVLLVVLLLVSLWLWLWLFTNHPQHPCTISGHPQQKFGPSKTFCSLFRTLQPPKSIFHPEQSPPSIYTLPEPVYNFPRSTHSSQQLSPLIPPYTTCYTHPQCTPTSL